MASMSGFGRLRPQKRADLIVDEIKRWIVAERKQPGDRLPTEKALIELFGCSKGTIREALKSLEVQGLVSVKTGPQGGASLVSVSYEHAAQPLRNYLHFQNITGRQLYALRKVLQPELAASVVGRLAGEDFAELERSVAICASPARDNAERQAQRLAELDFHVTLAKRCPDPLLALMCRFLDDLLRDLVIYRKVRLPEQRAFSRSNLDYHRALVDAYRKEDVAAVRKLMIEHMEEAEHYNIELDALLADSMLAP